MLTLSSSRGSRDCTGVSRRDFLSAGTLGLGGLTLPWLLEQRAHASGTGATYVKDKAVVVLFLSGGASHIETFNPNMNAPAPFHSVTGEVQTTVPGMTFGGTFPMMAKHAEKFSVVRSFRSPDGGHSSGIVHVLNGGTDRMGPSKEAGYSMGAAYARLRGANHPRTGMPTFTLLNSKEVDGQYRSEHGRVMRGSAPGPLGASYAPFNPSGKGEATANMKLRIDESRLDDRRALLSGLDRLKRQAQASAQLEGVDRFKQQAFDLLLGSASEAFDLSQETPATVDRYDTSKFQVGKKVYRESQLGRHFLTARRLLEAGCGFITIHSAGWDMHADGNNPGVASGMEMLGRPVDKAVSAFLEDLEQRGLSDDVLLVITGEFGRTPKLNNRGGRDHWANLCTLALAGGGLNQGQVVGRSARNNDVPATDPYLPPNLLATIFHTLFDVGTLRVTRGVPRDLLGVIDNNAPIQELF